MIKGSKSMRRTRQRKLGSKLEEEQLIYLELYRQLRQTAAKKKSQFDYHVFFV